VDTEPAHSWFGDEVVPGRNVTSDADLTTFIESKGTTATLDHYIGSCRMGDVDNSEAVVDPRLRVLGVHGLRVVDASVIPGPTRHFVQATVVAFAEKASDYILEDASN